MRPSETAQELVQRRQRAATLFIEGWTNPQIANRLGTTAQSVGRWRRHWEAGGAEALAPKPAPGRPSKLSARQERGLRQRLLSGARKQGFATDLWTGRRARELIGRCYGVEYHIGYVDRLLTQLHFPPQKPEPRAAERDEAAVTRWIQHDWPRIKRDAHRRGAHLGFIDETGYLLTPLVRRTWAPKRQTPVLRVRMQTRRKASAIGAITISPTRRRLGRYVQLHRDRSISQDQALAFLQTLRRHVRGPLVVIWDQLRAHRGEQVRGFVHASGLAIRL